MKPFLWNFADWCVLAAIIWASQLQTPIAARLLDAAAVWVCIVNVLTITYLLGLLAFKEVRDQMEIEKQNRNRWQKTHDWLSLLISLAVFAWAGWAWSFGIRLLNLFASEIFSVYINRRI